MISLAAMPLLSVQIDGKVVVALPTEGCNIVGARIGGTRDDEVYADLSAWGGTYGQGNADVHCIWLDGFKILPEQVVEVQFAASGNSVGSGKAFDASGVADRPPNYSHEGELKALAQELRGQPWIRSAYKFHYESNQSEPIDYFMASDEYGFGFNVLWNEVHPHRLSVSLHAYTIESVEHQQSGRTLATERLLVGQGCRLNFVA
jgi:hypothetical protein